MSSKKNIRHMPKSFYIYKILILCVSSLILSSCAFEALQVSNTPGTEDISNVNPMLETMDKPVTDASLDTVDTEPETDPPEPEILYDPVILMYHLILEEPYNNYKNLFVRPQDFAEHLDVLNDNGYTYIFADEYKQSGNKSVVLTFDDGYEDNYTEMFPILKEKEAKATVFLITDMIGKPDYLNREQIKEMSDSGYVSFQSHTKSHLSLQSLDEDHLREQFEISKSVIEEITGRKVSAIAYPAGRHNNLVCKIAGEYFSFGYTTKSPVYVSPDDHMRIPRYGVWRDMRGKGLINMIK